MSEGFGELLAEELSDSINVTIRKPEERKETAEQQMGSSEIIQKLLEAEFERRMQKRVREKLEAEKNEFKNQADGLNAAVAKLRLLFKSETSYEEMKTQVSGIEKEEKNNQCSCLLKLINPAIIKEEVLREMQQDYQLTSEVQFKQLSRILCRDPFKNVYKAYLAELKYFAKTIGGEGEK